MQRIEWFPALNQLRFVTNIESSTKEHQNQLSATLKDKNHSLGVCRAEMPKCHKMKSFTAQVRHPYDIFRSSSVAKANNCPQLTGHNVQEKEIQPAGSNCYLRWIFPSTLYETLLFIHTILSWIRLCSPHILAKYTYMLPLHLEFHLSAHLEFSMPSQLQRDIVSTLL